MNNLTKALASLLIFVTTVAKSISFVTKRKNIAFTTKFMVDADPVLDENNKLIGVKNIRVVKSHLVFEKNANLVTRTFKAGIFVAFGEFITELLKGISNSARNEGIRALNVGLGILAKTHGLKLVGNRYLDQFAYSDGVKRATLLFHPNGVKGFTDDLSVRLFGVAHAMTADNSVKFFNYVWAGCQTSFGTTTVSIMYAPVNAGGTDGASYTTLDYLSKVNPELAAEMLETGAHQFKQQSFASLKGTLCPIKGMVVVAHNETQWDALQIGVSYEAAKSVMVVSENEVKLIPNGLKFGEIYTAKFAVISHSGEESLRKAFWRSNAQLLARTNWANSSKGKEKAYKNAVKKLEAIQSLEGYLDSVFHLQSNDIEDETWTSTRMSVMTIAGQIAAGLPFAAFEKTADGEAIATRELKKGLKGMICSLPRLTVPGSYFFPLVDDRLVDTWEVGVGSMFARELSQRWHSPIKNGTILMVQRSPHIGSGYLKISIKLIDELGAFDGIVLSRKCANFLAADCDGDRVSLSLPTLGEVTNPTEFPKIEDAAAYIVRSKLPATGNPVADNLLAATLGKMIGLVDWLMTKLHEEEGSLTKNVLAFGAHVSQEVISASKHIGEDVIDLEAVSEIINPLRSYQDKSGKTRWFRETTSLFYRFITGKIEDVSEFADKKGNVPHLPSCYNSTPLKGIYDALVEKGVNPFWNSFDWKADQNEWVRMVKNAQNIVVNRKADSEFGALATLSSIAKTEMKNGKIFLDPAFFMSKSRIPVLHAAISLLGKSAQNAEEARKLLREHFDDKIKVLGAEYPRYLVGFWARVFATGTPERALMMCLNTAEFALVVKAIKTWSPEKGCDWEALAEWAKIHSEEVAVKEDVSEDVSAAFFD